MHYTGGCQCGAIRYRAEGLHDHACICYCRMCQKASGGPFMAFVRFRESQVSWSKPLDVFASSNLVERGFCATCGTPLSYRLVDGGNISLTLNSLDHPDAVRPTVRYEPHDEVAWCRTLATLPGVVSGDAAGMINNQVGP